MCRLGITIAPRGEMIMKSKMTVNCRNPRMPITTFSYRENLIRTGAGVACLSMRFLCQESDPKVVPPATARTDCPCLKNSYAGHGRRGFGETKRPGIEQNGVLEVWHINAN